MFIFVYKNYTRGISFKNQCWNSVMEEKAQLGKNKKKADYLRIVGSGDWRILLICCLFTTFSSEKPR